MRVTRVTRRAVGVVILWSVDSKNGSRWISVYGGGLDGGGCGRGSRRGSVNFVKSGLSRLKPFNDEEGIIKGVIFDVGVVSEKVLSGLSI